MDRVASLWTMGMPCFLSLCCPHGLLLLCHSLSSLLPFLGELCMLFSPFYTCLLLPFCIYTIYIYAILGGQHGQRTDDDILYLGALYKPLSILLSSCTSYHASCLLWHVVPTTS